MLSRIGSTLRKLRRRFSRTQLLIRWLRLEDAGEQNSNNQHGVVVLQLDGLSRKQFEAAICKHRLPFLKKMIDRGYFDRMSFYSGVPSTTPAVQAEVMYGVPCAVPSFQFLHRATGRIFRMFDMEAASATIREQCAETQPLLRGGASYSNLYSGGAEESACCAETTDVSRTLSDLNPLRAVVMLALYFVTLLRITLLTFAEVLVATFDMLKALFCRKDWRSEIRFVPARVLVSVIMREWVRIVVKLAMARGKPIIYANLLGYDEQSHRRGPDSYFAHWGLKGIDRTIEDIFHAAQREDTRDYEVIVFSDHGQEAATVYEFRHGQSIQTALKNAFSRLLSEMPEIYRPDDAQKASLLNQRTRHLMRTRRGRKATSDLKLNEMAESVVVTAMGPLGHIYLPEGTSTDVRAELAQELVLKEHVPLVLYRDSSGAFAGRNRRGLWNLPDDIISLVGPQNHFADEIATDLIRLCQHENAGDLIISGWDPESEPMTFVQENGAHGSIGLQETRGFALIPQSIPVESRTASNGEKYIRGIDLHDCITKYRESGNMRSEWNAYGRTSHEVAEPAPGGSARGESSAAVRVESSVSLAGPAQGRLRVMTWNVHHCRGMDGKCRPDRISRVIADSNADLVALQELDAYRPRSRGEHQAALIAAQLGMYHRYFPVWEVNHEKYGLAVISRYPVRLFKEGLLNDRTGKRRSEPRGAIWVKVDTPQGEVSFLNTHLGLTSRERREQTHALLSSEWLGRSDSDHAIVVAGDFNAGLASPVVSMLSENLQPATPANVKNRHVKTFPSPIPLRWIDHILVSPHFEVEQVQVLQRHPARVASDHLPLVADLVICPPEQSLDAEASKSREVDICSADEVFHQKAETPMTEVA
ncbi:MAG: endonuclease/exonuclease/phosphatase family protein [Planctomycetaceae bacterium]|nr:endonuclease/exonuclease/phosphatase family protein [Planctomycetaceae bacterium]